MNADFSIVPMTEEHLPALAEIERLCFSDPWSEEGLSAELGNPTARFYVALQSGVPVGYAGMHNVMGEGYITNVAVRPEYRRRGEGSRLLEHLLVQARKEKMQFITLEVRPSNHAAIALYRFFGFEQVGLRRGYYRRPTEDAVLMTLSLGKESGGEKNEHTQH